MPGTIRVALPCGCAQETFMGQKREKRCACGNVFEKPGTGSQRPRRRSSLKRGRGFAVSQAQRDKVRGLPCANCGREASEYVTIDPAHLWPRGKGGCDDDALCVIPLCRLMFLGYFDSPEAAAEAYDESAIRLHGAFASPNGTADRSGLPSFGGKHPHAPNTYRCPDLELIDQDDKEESRAH